MKRMWSEKQIENIAKESAGGLPEIEVGDAGKALVVNEAETGVEWAEVGAPDNVLVLPESAPAAQQLVGVNTSNEQNALGIGNGLEVASSNIELVNKELVLDFNSLASLTLSDDQVTDITAEKYYKIKIINYGSSNYVYEFLSVNKSSIALKWFNNNVGAKDNPTVPYIYIDRTGIASSNIVGSDSYIGTTDCVITGNLLITSKVLTVSFTTSGTITFQAARGKFFGTGTTGELYSVASPKGNIPNVNNTAYGDVVLEWINTSAYPHVCVLFRVVAIHQSASGNSNVQLYLTGEDYNSSNQVTKYLCVMSRSGSKWNYTITTL